MWGHRLLSMLSCVALGISSITSGQQVETHAACGSAVHYLTGDPLLTSAPAPTQQAVHAALDRDILQEAFVTDACYKSQVNCDLNALGPLHMHKLEGNSALIWWDVPLICGSHGNCPVWLVELGPGRARNLVHSTNANNPGNSLGGGWGAAVLPGPGSHLMITSHGYRPQGGPELEAECWGRHDAYYVSEACPVECFHSLNGDMQ